MPLYEYQCTKCQERLEVIQNFSDPPFSHCPKCGGDMKKLISAPAIQFKGSGFYKTDYPSSTSSAGSGSKSDSSRSEGSKSEGTKSEGTKSDSSRPESSKSEGTKSESSKSEGSGSKKSE
jgi:putative FmdB family regulatory protein